jgi:hypothetical protein
MVTAITHHRFSSPLWGEPEVLKLYAELVEIEVAVIGAIGRIRPERRRQPSPRPLGARPVLARVEESQHGQNTAVHLIGFRQPQLHKNAAHMFFDRTLRDPQLA